MPRPVPTMLTANAVNIPIGAPTAHPAHPPIGAPMKTSSFVMCVSLGRAALGRPAGDRHRVAALAFLGGRGMRWPVTGAGMFEVRDFGKCGSLDRSDSAAVSLP